MRNKGFRISIFLLISLTFCALLFVDDFVQAAWKDHLPKSITRCIDFFYPRFQTEKHRLPFEFFLEKANLVLIRLLFVEIGLLGFISWKSLSKRSELTIVKTSHSTKFLITTFYGFLLITTHDWFCELDNLNLIAPFYKPILILLIFGQELPHTFILQGLYLIMAFLCLVIILKKGLKWAPTIVIVLFIYLEATFNSFEKINHGYATFIYTGLLLPIYLYNPRHRKWSISVIQVVIASCYFLAGLEKLTISGSQWFSFETMSIYLSQHQTVVGIWVSKQPILCFILSVSAILFQLTFPLFLFIKKLKKPILITGVLFHWGTVVLFGISSFLNPWLVVYVFFIDTKKIVKRIKKLRKP